MRSFRKRLAVELADFFRYMLYEVNCGVALDAIVIASIVEPLLEIGGELLHGRDRRIDRQPDMATHPVGRLAGEVDHFLSEQGCLADQRLVEALLFGFP
jgi:hypothetical protein